MMLSILTGDRDRLFEFYCYVCSSYMLIRLF